MKKRRFNLKQEVDRLHRDNPNATTGEIAQMLGVMPEYVRTTFRRLNISAPRAHRSPGIEMRLSGDTARKLRPFADARGVNIRELAERVISTVASEGIVDAVLDDQRVNP